MGLKSNTKSLKSSKNPKLRRSKDTLHPTPHMPELSPQLPELSPHMSTIHMVILFTSVKLILNLMPPTFSPTPMLVSPTLTHTTTTIPTTQLFLQLFLLLDTVWVGCETC